MAFTYNITKDALYLQGFKDGFEKGFEEGFREGFEKGFKEGLEEGRREAFSRIIRNMKKADFSVEDIIKAAGLT